jgi:hypothetical protein
MRCPLWIISGQTVSRQNLAMSAVVEKRTNAGAAGLSAKCHKRTFLAARRSHAAAQEVLPRQFPVGRNIFSRTGNSGAGTGNFACQNRNHRRMKFSAHTGVAWWQGAYR